MFPKAIILKAVAAIGFLAFLFVMHTTFNREESPMVLSLALETTTISAPAASKTESNLDNETSTAATSTKAVIASKKPGIASGTAATKENSTPTSTTTISAPVTIAPIVASAAIEPVDIPPLSIVGLWCYYTLTNSSLVALNQGDTVGFQGSGVIVSPEGHLLTAKHIIDPQWTWWAYASSSESAKLVYDNLTFEHCDVAVPPKDYVLPTWEKIQKSNPEGRLDHPRYKAAIHFNPATSSMSETEAVKSDFAILRITGPSDNCWFWYKDCNANPPFPYSRSLYSVIPPVGNAIMSYGYPLESFVGYGSQFYIKGAVGQITGYKKGDGYFSTTPFIMEWNGDDVVGGRSGSPVYWKGHVAGILYSKTSEKLESQIIGMPAIQKVLKDNGLGDILKTD